MDAAKTLSKEGHEMDLVKRVEATKKSGECCMCQRLIAENTALNDVMMVTLQAIFDLVPFSKNALCISVK